MERKKHHYFTTIIATLVIIAGCGPANPRERQNVSGTVTFNGTPLANGSILFEPQDGQNALSGAPIIDGKFSIAEHRGLPPGSYLVRISAQVPRPSKATGSDMFGESRIAVEMLPADWNRASQHTITVEKGKNQFDFNIKGD